MTLVGLTALSVEIRMKNSTPDLDAAVAAANVPNTLLFSPSSTLFESAARAGDQRGAINAAILLKTGSDGPAGLIRAYAWLNIVASQGDDGASKLKESVANQLTREQVDEAQRLSLEIIQRRNNTLVK
jgi:hypothetical protein